jgi:hypothetical protein
MSYFFFALCGVSAAVSQQASLPQAVVRNEEKSNQEQIKKVTVPHPVSTIEVNGDIDIQAKGLAVPYHITQDEVLSSAGTWGDFSRYLQLMPGVVWNSDMSNDILVRGGNPSENLYVVDGIEVPNINHLAMEGTTGGFSSMLDTSTIESVDMKAGVYDARYFSRLSSLIDVHTIEQLPSKRANEIDLGISGIGGFFQHPLGRNAGLLLTAHRSVLNLVTNDIGINGVPIYTDGMAKLVWVPSSKDRISVLSLNGADSINITPAPCDSGVTLQVQTEYSGGRSTNGLIWRHLHNTTTFSTLTASYSAQNQNIDQEWQAATYNSKGTSCSFNPSEAPPLYIEKTHDGVSTVDYGVQMDRRHWLYTVGATGRLVALNYNVSQPLGEPSPFNTNSAWTDTDNFVRDFTAGQSSVYAETTGHLGDRWSVIAGLREEFFALTAAQLFEPRISVALRINEHQAMNGTYARSSQLAPYIDILSYAGNNRLKPLQVEQFALGADLWRADRFIIGVEGYSKRYSNEPVSTEYPALMLANMVDTLGQEFVWLPLKDGGYGRANGIEMLLRAHTAKRFRILASASYSRTRYAAADGVLRSGNYDFPVVANVQATVKLPWKFEIAGRNTYATGRPYTPFNITLSEQQKRGIYDLTKINAVRGPFYDRTDVDVNRDFHLRRGVLNVHAGVENALNRQNFMGYAWMDNCSIKNSSQTMCGDNINAIPGVPETEITQMPVFPSAGIHYDF